MWYTLHFLQLKITQDMPHDFIHSVLAQFWPLQLKYPVKPDDHLNTTSECISYLTENIICPSKIQIS